ncbi:hypothetical protein F5Y05DRAFT_259503 [Hypoxylon sp. FL0543]|nr:hypothetical protein F5Y05DRAFT_259503 [Hypoxylon sp. FL0543]
MMSPRLSPTIEEPKHKLEHSNQTQRRSFSEPVSPRASFGNRESLAARRRDGSITCFPRLPSRTCTSDWLTPLGFFGESNLSQHRATMSDLYACGVDAHCGVDIPKPLEMLEESPRQTPVPIDESPFRTPELQWPTHPNEGSEPSGFKPGRAIGVSAHCRRSSAKPMEARGSDVNHGLLDKLRRYSFMPLLDHTPESIRGASLPTRTWTEVPLYEDGGRRRSSKQLLQSILDRRPAPKRMSWKLSRKSSRSSAQARRKRTISSTQKRRTSGLDRMSCSEDHHPHICMDEQLTPTPFSGSEVTFFE